MKEKDKGNTDSRSLHCKPQYLLPSPLLFSFRQICYSLSLDLTLSALFSLSLKVSLREKKSPFRVSVLFMLNIDRNISLYTIDESSNSFTRLNHRYPVSDGSFFQSCPKCPLQNTRIKNSPDDSIKTRSFTEANVGVLKRRGIF